jgi:predicted ribosome quality control (RQC) complex YloA/Tae2 family protein
MRIPFDSFVLAEVVDECQGGLRGRVQRITQPAPLDVVLEIHSNRQDYSLLLSADPSWARAYLISKRLKAPKQPPVFCMALRKALEGAFIDTIRQVGFDRILDIHLQGVDGQQYRLIAELMGKHSNLILANEKGEIINAVKHITTKQSRLREVLPHRPYLPPPTTGKPNPLTIRSERFDYLFQQKGETSVEKWLVETFEGISPFLAKELLQQDNNFEEAFFRWQERVISKRFEPVLVRDEQNHPIGAYPMPLQQAPTDQQFPRDQISPNLEYYFDSAITRATAIQARSSLEGSLKRALAAREEALSQIGEAIEEGKKADRFQLFGDLILTYGSNLPPKAESIEAPDYTDPEQLLVIIPLDSELTTIENAERFFKKAKKAKGSAEYRISQHGRLQLERDALLSTFQALETAGDDMRAVDEVRETCVQYGWLTRISLTAEGKPEAAPFEGKRIRTIIVEGKWQILYGENAEANDYLTQKVARPNDWWLHVRAAVSAHVVVRTGNNPLKVPRKILEQAAEFAVRNSPSKHASLVPVDYTLKKYVRKPKSAPPGTVLYSHEKTLYVTSSDIQSRR